MTVKLLYEKYSCGLKDFNKPLFRQTIRQKDITESNFLLICKLQALSYIDTRRFKV